MSNDVKFVDFEKYCKTCEYEKKKESESPCNECLDICAGENSSIPERWVKKEETEKHGGNTVA